MCFYLYDKPYQVRRSSILNNARHKVKTLKIVEVRKSKNESFAEVLIYIVMKKISNSCKCPYCGQRLTWRQYLEYWNKAKVHFVRCSNCGRSIHPKKDPYSPQRGVYFGALSSWLPATICLHVFHTDFITACLGALPFMVVTFFLSVYIWYKNLYFE